MRAFDKSRTGATIIEVLTVIGILSLLMALLLPGIAYSRERARKMQCQNQLHQIGLAFHQFEETNGVLPTTGFCFSRISGYVDNQENSFRCPSDPRNAPPTERDRSYMINDGTRFRTKQRNGMIVQHHFLTTRDIKSADITDGMSQTAAASERLLCLISDQGNSESVLRSLDPRRVLWYPSILYATEAALAAACATDRQTPYPLDVRPTGAGDTGYDHILPPNVPGCYNSPAIANGLPLYNSATPPSSLHNNAVNVLLCDGSVRSIMNTIDVNIWRAMGTRNGSDHVEW